jgi:hypothetical protein
MRLLICGDRNWSDARLILQFIIQLMPEVIIEGDAKGADRLAGEIAESLGITLLKYPALWSIYNRAAGPIRNQQMIDEGKPTKVLAFHDDIANSKGTKDMVNRAKKNNIPVEVITHGTHELLELQPTYNASRQGLQR